MSGVSIVSHKDNEKQNKSSLSYYSLSENEDKDDNLS